MSDLSNDVTLLVMVMQMAVFNMHITFAMHRLADLPELMYGLSTQKAEKLKLYIAQLQYAKSCPNKGIYFIVTRKCTKICIIFECPEHLGNHDHANGLAVNIFILGWKGKMIGTFNYR